MYYPNFFEGEARLLEGLRNRVNRAFSDFFAEDAPWAPNGLRARAFPTLNVWEDSDNLYAECELPGVRMEDLEAYVVGSELTIKGERKPQEFEGATHHRRERETGSFSRIVHLPVHVDSGKVSAELHDGVLTVKLPKAAEAKPRKIQVKAVSK